MANLWYLGMILAVFASAAGTIGKQLIRFSELQRRRGTAASAFASKVSMFIAMALMTIIGPLIDMGSYAFAPQSLIAPLGALDVVWNTLLAPFTLGESLTPILIGGCVLIAAGAVLSSIVGDHEDKTYNKDEMIDTFFRWQVLVYLLTLAAWISSLLFVPVQRSSAPKGQPWEPGDKGRGLALGLVAGSIAGNMFCVKAFVELVQGSIKDRDGSVWLHWLPYFAFAGALFFALSNLYFLTKGMKEFEALFMGSVFEGTLIVAACLSGGIVFKEFEVFSAVDAVLYCLALLGIVGGIAAVANGMTKREETDDTENKDNDEGSSPADVGKITNSPANSSDLTPAPSTENQTAEFVPSDVTRTRSRSLSRARANSLSNPFSRASTAEEVVMEIKALANAGMSKPPEFPQSPKPTLTVPSADVATRGSLCSSRSSILSFFQHRPVGKAHAPLDKE